MNILKILGIVFICIYTLSFFVLLIRTKKPFKTAFLNAFLGLWLFALLNLTAFFTGLNLPVNYGTVGVSSFFGVGGVILLEVLYHLIFV